MYAVLFWSDLFVYLIDSLFSGLLLFIFHVTIYAIQYFLKLLSTHGLISSIERNREQEPISQTLLLQWQKTYTVNDLNWHIIIFLVIYFCSSITFTRQWSFYVLTVEVSDSSHILVSWVNSKSKNNSYAPQPSIIVLKS